MKGIKRHNVKSAERLLQQLMSAVNGRLTQKQTQNALLALLEGEFGGFRIVADKVAELRRDPVRIAQHWLPAVENVLFGLPQYPNTPITVQVRSMRISLKATEAELDGPAGELTALQLILLLRLVGAHRVAQCTAALPFTDGSDEFNICGKYWLRKGKRTHCSATCQRRMYMRSKRAETAPIN